jgi:hypothetical protein
MSLVATRESLNVSINGDHRNALSILESVEKTSTSRCTLKAMERALDHAAALLRVRVDWSRGSSVPYEATASVHASEADGDGPSRLLATFEPLYDGNNAGNTLYNGHVRITPAFGVIIPSPDAARTNSIVGKSVSELPSYAHSATGVSLDDVPRGYVCPVVGGDIVSVITLLLCVRQLDALEGAARCGEAAVLDVDRQCFSVVVLCPRTGRTLRAKVWPRGPRPGAEVPSALVWLDDRRVESFPEFQNGRLSKWRKLLRELAMSHGHPVKRETDNTVAGNAAGGILPRTNGGASHVVGPV